MGTRRQANPPRPAPTPTPRARAGTPPRPPALVLVHAPQRLLGQALAAAAQTLPNISAITTTDADETLKRCAALQPALALLTTAPDDTQAVALTRTLTRRFPDTAIVLLANDPDIALLHDARDAGAALVLPLAADLTQLTTWLRALHTQRRRVALATWLRLAAQHAQPKLLPSGATAPLAAQQQRLLHLIAQGMTNAAIGHELGLSEKTIRNHISRMLAKLGASTRTEAVLIALSTRLIALPKSRPQPPPPTSPASHP